MYDLNLRHYEGIGDNVCMNEVLSEVYDMLGLLIG